jgi:adenosylhomocysteinase
MSSRAEFGASKPLAGVRNTWPDNNGPDLIVDGGDVTLLIHEGVKAELAYEQIHDTKPDPNSIDNLEFKEVLRIIAGTLESQPLK